MSELAVKIGLLPDCEHPTSRGVCPDCIAEQVTAWLIEQLAAAEMREAVGRAILDNGIGDPAKGEPFIRRGILTEHAIADAGAALTAVAERLGATP